MNIYRLSLWWPSSSEVEIFGAAVVMALILTLCLNTNCFGATPAFAERIQQLDVLRAQSLISSDEYAETRLRLILENVRAAEKPVENNSEIFLPPDLPKNVSNNRGLQDSTKPPTSVKIEWYSPAWRSALLPGWGQHFNKQKSKGYLLGGGTLALFLGGWFTYIAAENAANEYENMGPGLGQDSYDNSFSNWEGMANMNHAIVVTFGLAYVWTLIDAITNVNVSNNLTLKFSREQQFATLNLFHF